MAYLFAAASTQYLTVASTPVTASPLTLSCWFKPTTGGDYRNLLRIETSITVSTGFGLMTAAGDGSYIRYAVYHDGVASAEPNRTPVTAGAWNHAAGVSASSSSHICYLNGAVSGEVTTTVTPPGLDRVSVGGGLSSIAYPFDGALAEWGIWNVALTAAEIAVIAAGALPVNVRPASLVFYSGDPRGDSPVPDLSGGARPLTLVNGPVGTADHPPMRYPFPRWPSAGQA